MSSTLRGYSQTDLDKVKDLIAQGLTQAAIASETGIPVRTQRDWNKRGLLGEHSAWSEDKRWPGWTISDLETFNLRDFNSDFWLGNLARIQTAEASGNHYIGWFYRRLVDIERRTRMPEGALDWSLAIAGLPVLGHWLECTACDELAALVEKHMPWVGALVVRQKRRAAYAQEARPIAATMRQCIMESQANLFLKDGRHGSLAPGPVLLAALADRVPLFDRVKRSSPFRKYNFGAIILGILVIPKGSN